MFLGTTAASVQWFLLRVVLFAGTSYPSCEGLRLAWLCPSLIETDVVEFKDDNLLNVLKADTNMFVPRRIEGGLRRRERVAVDRVFVSLFSPISPTLSQISHWYHHPLIVS